MASLDSVYQITESLDADNIDYVVITLQKGKAKYKSDVFIGLEDKESIEVMGLLVESVYVHINDKDFLKKNKKVKRKKPPGKPPKG